MARQTVKSVSLTADARDQLNENFTELYGDVAELETTKVPYTGVTGTVDLGAQKLITGEIESVGDLILDCGTDSTVVLEGAVWEDIRFPATQTKTGSNLKPDFDETNVGLLFPQNDTAEIAYMVVQLPHSYKFGTNLYPHVHFIQTSAAVPIFKIAYRWYSNGSIVPAFTTITSSSLKFTYVSGDLLQVASFPQISGVGMDDLSSILDIKLYREDNVVTGDVLVKEFDIHYQIDTVGSRTEILK